MNYIIFVLKKKGPKKGTKYNGPKTHGFGQKLYELRKKKGLTQKELAAKMGKAVRTISYFEQQAKNPTLETIREFARSLEISESYFLGNGGNDGEIEETPQVIKSLRQRLRKLVHLKRKDQEALVLVIDGFLAKTNSAIA